MSKSDAMGGKDPQAIMRGIVELCADCDTCRFMMDVDCVFFPELYRLWDLEKEHGESVTDADLRRLAGLCTFCGLCPCPRIPMDVMDAKSRYVEKKGLSLATRMLADVPQLFRWFQISPQLITTLQSSRVLSPLLRKITGLHADREFPSFAEEDFFQWAESHQLTSRSPGIRNVAYFAGCTAGFLFPQIGRATVLVLQRNGISVYTPPQQCCGMPQLVEGDRHGALLRARANVDQLLDSIQAGDDLVCSCPTCGYMMKVLLKERAYYSAAYQHSVGATDDELKLPVLGVCRHMVLKKSVYKDILKDDGYFSSLDPMGRIKVAEKFNDVGEYLGRLHAEGRLDTSFSRIDGRVAYFAPCHQREQKMGRPYFELLGLIPGLQIVSLSDTECCGMGGNFGFKADFHEHSLTIGRPLFAKIRKVDPQAIITDCMSCRLQFQHVLPYAVFHPLEILAQAYQQPPCSLEKMVK